MLALDAKVQLTNWPVATRLMKVAALDEFASGQHALSKMLLDLRRPEVAAHVETLGMLPWAGFIANDGVRSPEGRPSVTLHGDTAVASVGDVIEVDAKRSKAFVRYRRGGNGNVLFATERCNSFCLMCSQPPRQVDDDWRVAQLCDLVDLIDRDLLSLAISGGEPTLLGDGLRVVIAKCAEILPDTSLHVLSNGRLFGEDHSALSYQGVHPALSWGVPLYGDTYGLHDYVVQSVGAFAQTLRGLYALHAAGQRIEVRVVLVKPSVERLEDVARFIYRNLPFVEHVALMGVEPIGLARANHTALWIDPVDAAPHVEQAALFLDRHGLSVSIYNMPLCTLPRSLWPFAKRSISDWKQDYFDACQSCDVRHQCSGVFGWKTPGWTSRGISPIRRETSDV